MDEAADIVIVGAGSAGCVMAARLAEDAGRQVVLIEAGSDTPSTRVRQPDQWPLLWDDAENWGYGTTLQSGLGLRGIPFPRGKALGGTSAINAMIAMRGDPADFDNWRDLGNPGWGWTDVLPYFKRLEDHVLGASALHGVGGPLTVSAQSSPSPITQAFIEAALASGHRSNHDFNGEHLEGAGLYHVSIRDGERCSTAVAYLGPAMERPNLRVIQKTRVLRVHFEDNRAAAIDVWDGSQLRRIHANQEVILCAGAIDTPKLLMLSGVGDPTKLRSHGITVRHDLPAVGMNLCDHVQTPTVFALKQPMAVASTSILAEGGLFMRRAEAKDGFGAHLQFFAFPQLPLTVAARGVAPVMAIAAQACRPSSRGQVRLRSADPLDPPLIDPGYLTHPDDLALQIEGVRMAREIAASEPLAGLLHKEVSPGAHAASGAALEAAIRATSGSVWHPIGTCRMGPSGSDAVVDPALRVHGLRNLRVVDASVMPQITSANTNLPTIMLAEKAADLVTGRSARITQWGTVRG
jgi:choline dehydrogenase